MAGEPQWFMQCLLRFKCRSRAAKARSFGIDKSNAKNGQVNQEDGDNLFSIAGPDRFAFCVHPAEER
jgi:hypothetical protein